MCASLRVFAPRGTTAHGGARRPRGRRSAKASVVANNKTSVVACLVWFQSVVMFVDAEPRGLLTAVEFKEATWGTFTVVCL